MNIEEYFVRVLHKFEICNSLMMENFDDDDTTDLVSQARMNNCCFNLLQVPLLPCIKTRNEGCPPYPICLTVGS